MLLCNHNTQVQYFCAGQDTAKIISNCNGMWNRHQVKDEIKDHTTPGELRWRSGAGAGAGACCTLHVDGRCSCKTDCVLVCEK